MLSIDYIPKKESMDKLDNDMIPSSKIMYYFPQ